MQPPQFAELPATFYSSVNPESLNRPYWVAFNPRLVEALGLDEDFQTASNLAYLSGSTERCRSQPLVTVYNGHQFGTHTPQLDGGRVLLPGDSEDRHGRRWEWQLEGMGKTPYSRLAGGRAVLRLSIRGCPYSEAMYGFGIPTTCALVLRSSQDPVYHERQEIVAVLTRIAPGLIHLGHFKYLFYQGRGAESKLLADLLVRHHYPDCRVVANSCTELLYQTGLHTASLTIARQSVGFCHNVLNIDSMSALRPMIDYGLFGFMDAYDRHYASNHSDGKDRYTYNVQPYIMHWNFSALANCLESLVPEEFINQTLEQQPDVLQTAYPRKVCGELGLQHAENGNDALIADLLAALQDGNVDFTLPFKYLVKTNHVHGDPPPIELENLFGDNIAPVFNLWLGLYRRWLRDENSRSAERAKRMNRIDPLYVLRNHFAEQIIVLAQSGNYRKAERLRRCLKNPFEERAEFVDFTELLPTGSTPIRVGCSS